MESRKNFTSRYNTYTQNYVYDDCNKLIKAQVETKTGIFVAGYHYDVLGRCIKSRKRKDENIAFCIIKYVAST